MTLGVVVSEVVVVAVDVRRAILAPFAYEREARVPKSKEQFESAYEEDARPDPTAHWGRVRP